MNHTRLLNTYLVVAAIYLVGLIAFSESFNFTTKPLLLPWLLMAVYIFPTIRNRTWLFGALLFSWIGDILLLFVYKSQTFFIFGLVSFLIAHLAYILAFKNEIKDIVSKIISPIAKPDKIQIVSGLPKTRSGKIMRRILRKIAENDVSNLGDTTTLLDPSVVQEIIKNSIK